MACAHSKPTGGSSTALIATAVVAATMLSAAPASARIAFIDFERESHVDPNSAPLPLGPLPAGKAWGSVRFHSGSNGGTCIMPWPSTQHYGPKVLVGLADDGTTCDATKPLRIRTNGNAYLVGFFVIGKNPAGWRVTAVKADGTQFMPKRALQGTNPSRLNRWVWIADPEAKIANVYIEPWDNSNPGVKFGIEGVTVGLGTSGSEDADE